MGWKLDKRRSVAAAFFAIALVAGPAAAQTSDPAAKGAYLFQAGGCENCHTDRAAKVPAAAGGAAIDTPFGKFYPPNITPHDAHGVGRWSEADFIRAMRHGVGPGGRHYFPVFPFTSFTNISESDLKAMWRYMRTLPAIDRANRPHDVPFPFSWRFLQMFWKWLFFTPGPLPSDPARDTEWNRGAYLVRALTHCGECHTPRNRAGALDDARWMAGTADGPEGEAVPNITPDKDTGIGAWSADELVTYLQIGLDPDGDVAGSLMGDVIEGSTSKLSDQDVAAIARYILSLPPIRNRVSGGK